MPAWLPLSALGNTLTQADAARIQGQAEEEYRRLLYVGMTRAADRLIICGYRGARQNPDIWHTMIAASLGQHAELCSIATFSGPDGEWNGLRWRVGGTAQSFEQAAPMEPRTDQAVLPAALLQPLPAPRHLPRPLSPSGAGTIIDEEAGNLAVASPLFGDKAASDRSLEKGRLVHRMLQMLPEFPPAERAEAAQRYAERTARFWPVVERQALVNSVLALMAHEQLQGVFTTHAQAEVSIMGTLTLETQSYAVSGRIDRLAVLHDRVVVLDYKTNRVPPATLGAIPFAHKAQLAIYREILAPLYPGKRIDCVLVYSEDATIHTLPDDVLRSALAELKTK